MLPAMKLVLNNMLLITGSAVALYCCKAHSNINRKMENLTPCIMVTPENFILKLGTRDYVEELTYYTFLDVDRLSGGFSPNGWNITLL